jgi:acyl carrier protein
MAAAVKMVHDISGDTKRIIREQLQVPDAHITPQASFTKDLGADSMHFIELTLALEEHFDIDISDDDAEGIRTVQDAIDFIQRRFSDRNFERPPPAC